MRNPHVIEIRNGPKKPLRKLPTPAFKIQNKDDESKPLEILIYDLIEESGAGGFSANDLVSQIQGVTRTRELHVRVNSRGGNVNEGVTIYNRLREWEGKTVAIVDGSAASIASVIIMGCDEVHMPRSAEILIHEANAFVMAIVTAEEIEKLASEMGERLESASNRIAGVYAGKTGRSVEEMRGYMRKTTVFDGAKAKAIGLADVLTDETPLYNLTEEDISAFRHASEVIVNQQRNIMRKKIIALLNKHSIKFEESASDDQLVALLKTSVKNSVKFSEGVTDEQVVAALETIEAKAVNDGDEKPAKHPTPAPAPTPVPAEDRKGADIVNLQAEINALKAVNEQQRESRLRTEITALASEGRLPLNSAEKWTKLALKNEADVMAQLRELPVQEPGRPPVNSVIVVAQDPREIEKAVLNLWCKNGVGTPEEARDRGRVRAEIIAANWSRLMPVMNVNTVSSDLKRTVILQRMIRAFAIRILPLTAFSTRLGAITLEGTNKVTVPYFALSSTVVQDFVAANGYDTFTDIATDAKTVTIDERKWLGLKWTSEEWNRLAYMDVEQGARLKAERLAIAVVNDVLSLVTAANFGAAAKTEPASAFDSDDVIDLKGTADQADWPDVGRSLILSSEYDIELLKDTGIKFAEHWGGNEPIREGRIGHIAGFDYYANAHIPDNGEALKGFISFPSAILFAQSPIEPTPEVRKQLSRYEVLIEPSSGASFEYRLWGNPDMDQTREVIECNYGFALGEAAALKRITES